MFKDEFDALLEDEDYMFEGCCDVCGCDPCQCDNIADEEELRRLEMDIENGDY